MVVREAAWGRIGVHAEKFSEQGHEQGHMGRVPWVGCRGSGAVGRAGRRGRGRWRGGVEVRPPTRWLGTRSVEVLPAGGRAVWW